MKHIINYLKNCYKSENRGVQILNFINDDKIEHKYFLTHAEAFDGSFPLYPIDEEWGDSCDKTLTIYAREKELFLSLFFISNRKYSTPLIIVPCKLIKDVSYYIQPIFDEMIFNIDALKTVFDRDEYLELSLSKNIDLVFYHELISFCRDNFPNLNTDSMVEYPKLLTIEEINKISSKKEELQLLPVGALGVLKKSFSAQGILNELQILSQNEDYSSALKVFLGEKNINFNRDNSFILDTPILLNDAQKNLFNSVKNSFISLIEGPPGTGKSFTISALAISSILSGKSVLITSVNNQAVDVIKDKLEKQFDFINGVVRGGGRGDYKKEMIKRLDDILTKTDISSLNINLEKELTVKYEDIKKNIQKIEYLIEKKGDKEYKRGLFFKKVDNSIFSKIKKQFISWRVKNEISIDKLFIDLYNFEIEREKLLSKLLSVKFNNRLIDSLIKNRSTISSFLSALKSKTGGKKNKVFDSIDISTLTSIFPIWLVSIPETAHILPFIKEMFDYVIIDEATQCNQAICLPIFQRGKNIVISGDTKQLRHISFLSQKKQDDFAIDNNLSDSEKNIYHYRDNSLLDATHRVIQSQKQISFLDEHYRSLPEIISFSNLNFYNNSLKLMRSFPQNINNFTIEHIQIESKREEKGYNIAEAKFIIDKVKKIIDDNDKITLQKIEELNENRDNNYQELYKKIVTTAPSIGILSPFREQVDYLRDLVNKELLFASIIKYSILIGTAHSFQGEERDIMFISLNLDSSSHPSSYIYLQKPDVFNVSITRARTKQYIISSFGKNDIKSGSLLKEYFQFLENPQQLKPKLNETDDIFSQEVISYLKEIGVKEIYQWYSIGNINLDIFFIFNNKRYSIDLIGFSERYEEILSIKEYQILYRVNISVFPLPYSNWSLNSIKIKERIKSWIK
ncbi:hypothetical protein JXR93_09725 [bacterium]|nr:hypothetical protein [bacterium]